MKPRSASILALVNRTLSLPTVPEVLTRLSEVIAAEDSTADDVAGVIATDPSVSANVLRIVNSAYYGLQVRVSSIGLAVSVLGFGTIKKVALKAAVFSRFAQAQALVAGFDPHVFWRHSVFAGVAARTIGAHSAKLAGHHGEDLYVCGLLHDIGKIVLIENAADDYQRVLATCRASGRSQLEVEREVFGFTHADVGSVLGIKWFLPEDLTIAIRYHHDPTNDPFHCPLSSLVHLADHLAWSAGWPSLPNSTRFDLQTEVYEAIGIEPRDVEGLLPLVESDFASAGLPF